MAVRLILVASVFALSLPLPDRQFNNDLYEMVNAELSAVLSTVSNESYLPASLSVETLIADNSKEIKDAALALPLAQTPSPVAHFEANEVELIKEPVKMPEHVANKSVESPLDIAFDVIQEQFAAEAEAFTVAEAAAHVQRIPLTESVHALPPAPAAEDLTDHQADLHLASLDQVIRVNGPVGSWAMVELITEDSPEAILSDVVVAPKPGIEISESEWFAITALELEPDVAGEVALLESPEPATPEVPDLKRAMRLTLDAIAAWSNLAGRKVK